jgi:hypothetical protein
MDLNPSRIHARRKESDAVRDVHRGRWTSAHATGGYMRRTALFLALGLVAGTLAACDDDDALGPENADFTATLNGANEIPGVETTAIGSVTFDATETSITFRIEVENLADAIGAHIHIGDDDVEGPIIATLFEDVEGVDIQDGVLAEGIIDQADINAALDLSFAELLDVLENGSAYVNVHTIANPDGEIRGQITPQ